MSIKEALERTAHREGNALGQSSGNVYDQRTSIESVYMKKVLEAGRSILAEAGIPELLDELAGIIRPNFSDVQIVESILQNGVVSLGIEWNSQKTVRRDRSSLGYEYNGINVDAYSLTGDVVVWGQERGTALTRAQWSSDPKLVPDAIARAYHSPMLMVGPHVNIRETVG